MLRHCFILGRGVTWYGLYFQKTKLAMEGEEITKDRREAFKWEPGKGY